MAIYLTGEVVVFFCGVSLPSGYFPDFDLLQLAAVGCCTTVSTLSDWAEKEQKHESSTGSPSCRAFPSQLHWAFLTIEAHQERPYI